jgi:coenzyme Q-binding protein COQ10
MPLFKTTRRVAVPAHVAYVVAADVNAYKEFLPLLERSVIRGAISETNGTKSFHAELAIGYSKLNLRETFISYVICDSHTKTVTATSNDHPFKDMKTVWTIRDANGQSDVEISINYTMRSMLLQFAVTSAMDMAVSKVMSAFEAQALKLHKASITN